MHRRRRVVVAAAVIRVMPLDFVIGRGCGGGGGGGCRLTRGHGRDGHGARTVFVFLFNKHVLANPTFVRISQNSKLINFHEDGVIICVNPPHRSRVVRADIDLGHPKAFCICISLPVISGLAFAKEFSWLWGRTTFPLKLDFICSSLRSKKS